MIDAGLVEDALAPRPPYAENARQGDFNMLVLR
jgi:hypothetical protein